MVPFHQCGTSGALLTELHGYAHEMVYLEFLYRARISCDVSRGDVVEAHCYLSISGELIVSRYVAESITMIAGRFGHVGLCQLRTKLKKLQRETSYIAITGQWCGVIKSGCLNDQ